MIFGGHSKLSSRAACPSHGAMGRHHHHHHSAARRWQSRGCLPPPRAADGLLQFQVIHRDEEVVGDVRGAPDARGDAVWAAAVPLAAEHYHVAEEEVTPLGMRLAGHAFMSYDDSVKVALVELKERDAALVVAVPTGDSMAGKVTKLLNRVSTLERETSDLRRETSDLRRETSDLRRDRAEDRTVIYFKLYYQAGVCELLLLAAAVVRELSKQPELKDSPRSVDVKPWVRAVQRASSPVPGLEGLEPEDDEVIFSTAADTLRGDANVALHGGTARDDQAKAVAGLAADPRHASLLRIFRLVHKMEAADCLPPGWLPPK